MAKPPTLNEKIDQQKAKIPNPLFYFFIRIICHFLKRKYHAKIIIKDKAPKKGAFFLIFNHQSRLDYIWPILAARHRRLTFLIAYNEFFRKKFHFIFNLVSAIPKKNFSFETKAVKDITTVIKKGGALCFSPEGRNSYYGTNSPVVTDTGAFLKHFRIPVYLIKIKGAYLTNPKHADKMYRGKIEATLTKLDLSSISDSSVDDYLNQQLRFDEYEWQKTQQIQWSKHGGLADNLHRIIYQCPKCGRELTMKGENNTIQCSHCGNGATVDNYYRFTPIHQDCKIFSTPSKWAQYERKQIIDAIQHDHNYEYKEEVTIGMLPETELLGKNRLAKTVGKGTFIINHNGVTLLGTKHNKPFKISINYQEIYTIGMWPRMETCFFYHHGELYAITPKHENALKLNMLVEEMHRLHVNKWKNFSWEQDNNLVRKEKQRK